MLDELFGETGGAIAQFVLALIVVLILILMVAWLLKKLGGGRFGATNSGQAELEIIDTLAIDPKRRLVLVRHGKLEHLLLIGGGSDEVVERSIVGGLPITARMQANKAAPVAPEKPAEPIARPSSKFLDRLERTNAARKSSTPASTAASDTGKLEEVSDGTSSPSDIATMGASTAVAGAAVAGATVAGATGANPSVSGSAYAAMIAANNKPDSKSTTGAPLENRPADKTLPKEAADAKIQPAVAASIPPTPISAAPVSVAPVSVAPVSATPVSAAPVPATPPAPIDLPPLLDLPRSSSTSSSQAVKYSVGDTSSTAETKPLPQSEREALEQSLDAALHDSLLAPEPAKGAEAEATSTTVTSQSEASKQASLQKPAELDTPANDTKADTADDLDFNLFDDGELEREMEAALAGSSPSPVPDRELEAKSTAAIEAELAIEMEGPSRSEPASVSQLGGSSDTLSAPPVTEPTSDHETAFKKHNDEASADTQSSDAEPSAAKSADDAVAASEEAPKSTLPPLKDIPVELSRPDTVAVQIPSRGPAANATSVTKADNGIGNENGGTVSGEQMPDGPSSPVDLSQLLDAPSSSAPTVPQTNETNPSSKKSSDLDEEMRRLLGEIAGDPKAK